jgi:signal transduction histidine kinase/CheY-like chemotaxis protein
VLAGGAVLSLGLFSVIRGWERRELEGRAASLAHNQVEKLQVTLLRSMEVLYSIASLHAADGRIERNQFGKFVSQALVRQPELQALSWNPVVPLEQRTGMEAAAAAQGLAGFQIREMNKDGNFQPASARAEYVPVYFIEPLDRNATALGYDLGSQPERHSSIEQARDTGQAVATAPIRLAQGPDNQAGFLVLLPVYSGASPATLEERRQKLAGFAVAVFRVSDLVRPFFDELERQGIEAQLFDESPAGELLYSGPSSPGKTVEKDGTAAPLTVAGRRWDLIFQPKPQFMASESHAQSWLVLAGGLLFTLLTSAYLYEGWRRTGEIACVNAALQEEIIVRQQAEASARAANNAKSDFLASMSHEIRTPLNAILGYTQLMQRDVQLSPDQRDAVGGINASGRHLLGMINEILDLSKIEAGRMEVNAVDFSLAALADGLAATFRPLCAQKRIGFRLEIRGRTEIRVRGDEGKLRQVLINLVGNAVKFTNSGEVYVHFQAATDDRWLFEVVDTGFGIPEEERENIFKPFHQGNGAQHQGGTGLGLAIAQKQVELLGGELKLQSERGVGSRFHFQIPLAKGLAEVAERPARHTKRLAPGSSVRALVVDDNKENREVLGKTLSAVGCEVAFAEDGETALLQAPVWKPDIVFLDLLLPGINGPATARRLLSDFACAPPKIVAHTASAVLSHKEEALASGCVDFIAKPYSCESVYECLENYLGVKFETAEPAGESQEHPPLGDHCVVLGEDLCARLMVSAELHSTTALKACLQELRQGGPEANRLAEEIRFLMRSYDMDGIARLLARTVLPVKAGAQVPP